VYGGAAYHAHLADRPGDYAGADRARAEAEASGVASEARQTLEAATMLYGAIMDT
jgi:hypothetical protein